MSTRIARAARLPALVALALPALVSCHNGYGNNCCVSYTPTEGSYGVVAGDFNGDAFTDVVALSTLYPITAAGQSDVKAYLSTGPGAFAAPAFYGAGTDPLWIAAADLNNDGATDLVTASYDDGALAVLFGNKAVPGTFNPAVLLASPGASQVAVLDMNGDGLADLVSADFGVSLFIQTSPGTFAAPLSLYSGGANFVALGDLNGDGVPDVALTDSTGVKVLLRTGGLASTTFAAAATVFTQTVNANLVGANLIAIADIDGDGLNDLVITDPGPTGGATPTINVLLQDPSNMGSFLPPVSYPGTPNDVPVSIVLKDLTGAGNGALDIVIGNQRSVTVLLHDPLNKGKFLAATTYPASGANEIAIADVDGDGFLDIVTSNGATQPTVNGVVTTEPGVLLQSATTPGTFAALANLP
jgi:hypothetical protein